MMKKEKKLGLRVVLRPSSDNDKYYIAIRVTYCRKKSEYSLKYKVHKCNYNLLKETLEYSKNGILTHKDVIEINKFIKEEKEGIIKTFSLLQRTEPSFDISKLMIRYRRTSNNQYFSRFTLGYIDSLKDEGKFGTADSYLWFLKSLGSFYTLDKLKFSNISYEFVNKYVHFLRTREISENTVWMYLGRFRAIYNKAKKTGVHMINESPFDDFKMQPQTTLKRSLNKKDIARIAIFDCQENKKMELARDVFMFSFYSRGMSFVDVVHLKKNMIVGDTIFYSRYKTSQRLQVGVFPQLKAIIDKYESTDEYIFPYLKTVSKRTEFIQYRYALGTINRYLKILGEKLKINIPLTTYVARHSWATIAKKEGCSIATISESLGHTSEKTTRIYLQSFNNDTINIINEMVATAVFSCIKE